MPFELTFPFTAIVGQERMKRALLLNAIDPAIGGVRVLIYNEQGIAFAITSDQAHADRGPNHAPIGAVDWTTVFPPGGAGKIYPLP